MSEWQPIETAPKNGTRVLLFPGHEEDITVGFFERPIGRTWINRRETTGWRSLEGEIDGVCCDVMLVHSDIWPTHWMPLPDPPSHIGGER